MCYVKEETQQNMWYKSEIQCFNCKRFGHYKSERKEMEAILYAKVERTSNSRDEVENSILLIYDIAVEDKQNIWFLDSGCSNHMCSQKELFSTLDKNIGSEVKFGNNTKVPVMGKCNMNTIMKDGSKWCILLEDGL